MNIITQNDINYQHDMVEQIRKFPTEYNHEKLWYDMRRSGKTTAILKCADELARANSDNNNGTMMVWVIFHRNQMNIFELLSNHYGDNGYADNLHFAVEDKELMMTHPRPNDCVYIDEFTQFDQEDLEYILDYYRQNSICYLLVASNNEMNSDLTTEHQ